MGLVGFVSFAALSFGICLLRSRTARMRFAWECDEKLGSARRSYIFCSWLQILYAAPYSLLQLSTVSCSSTQRPPNHIPGIPRASCIYVIYDTAVSSSRAWLAAGSGAQAGPWARGEHRLLPLICSVAQFKMLLEYVIISSL